MVTLSLHILAALIMLAEAVQLLAESDLEIEGTITNVTGTKIQRFEGLVTVEARRARIDTDDPQFTNISDLKMGASIEVKAVTNPDGSIQATPIKVSDEKEEGFGVSGVIALVDTGAQTFTMDPVTISWDSQSKFKGVARPKPVNSSK
jgi:hypothetical protein